MQISYKQMQKMYHLDLIFKSETHYLSVFLILNKLQKHLHYENIQGHRTYVGHFFGRT